MRYLEIKFHDNDFSGAMTRALVRIWRWIKENNLDTTYRSIPEMFLELDKAGHLLEMVRRMVVLEAMTHPVEWLTRGLYWEQLHFSGKSLEEAIKQFEHYNSYIKVEIAFHKTKAFTKEWQNSEHAALDLKTGAVLIF